MFPLAGWGRFKLKSKNANILQQVQLPVLENNECRNRYREAERYMLDLEVRFSKKYVLCAGIGAGGKDVCFGDSGNPLMTPVFESGRFPFYQIGIVSYGFGKYHFCFNHLEDALYSLNSLIIH